MSTGLLLSVLSLARPVSDVGAADRGFGRSQSAVRVTRGRALLRAGAEGRDQ
ncbi:hypothetical protein ACIPSA_46650 [Streptomyces sp. NPDC086549]|uniref:hypothetical protein n=1 Tax=Streptomyces sp. NPDC086549 TaxID=3365752 RepID=UPI00380DD28A